MTIFYDLKNTNQVIKQGGRLLAIDVGTKRLGIAISDGSRLIASPKTIIKRQGNLKDFEKIKELLQEYQVVGIIIGVPINMDGSPCAMTDFSIKFSENFDEFLEKKFPIFFCDERLTSFEAREINNSIISRKKDQHCDDIAASIILQGFLDDLKC